MKQTSVLGGSHLSKRYGGVQALLDVSVSANAGEVLGVVGENGAGKSTLMKIFSGLEQPDAGQVQVSGREVLFHSPREALDAGVWFAPQELVLCPELSVTENLLAGQLPRRRHSLRVDWPAADAEAARRLATLGIDKVDLRRPVGALTVAERAFVQLARAMDLRVKVLIVDEPTAPMSGPEVKQTFEVLSRLKESGVAIIYVSHRLKEVLELCDCAVVLRNGQVAETFTKATLSVPKLITAMTSGSNLYSGGHSGGSPADADAFSGHAGVALTAHGMRSPGIHGAALVLDSGEIVAIYGSLGSGREEFAPCLMGLLGRIESLSVLGNPLSKQTPRQLIQSGVGYVPAERRSQGLVLDLTIRENLTLGSLSALTRFGILKRGLEVAVASHWIDELHIVAPSSEVPVGALSGGSQQKVLLARWLASGSRVLVLDEPTRGVDIATKAEIYQILHKHTENGGAVVMVSSDLEEVANVASRVLVMRSGRIVAELRGASEDKIASVAMGV